MSTVVPSRRRSLAVVASLVMTLVVAAGCQDDGRDLRDPTSPLPVPTTTSTTLPPDIVP